MPTASIYPVACLICENRDVWPVSVSSGNGQLAISLRCRTCHHEWTQEVPNAVTPAPAEQRPVATGSKMPS